MTCFTELGRVQSLDLNPSWLTPNPVLSLFHQLTERSGEVEMEQGTGIKGGWWALRQSWQASWGRWLV